jgi:hypothetical protein
MKIGKFALPILALALAGCATKPSDIAPAMVDTTRYQSMSCGALLLAAQNEGVNLEEVTKDQRGSRNWDIALNILIIPGFGAVTGDSEREVAEAKGRILAIQNEYGTRCDQPQTSTIQQPLVAPSQPPLVAPSEAQTQSPAAP